MNIELYNKIIEYLEDFLYPDWYYTYQDTGYFDTNKACEYVENHLIDKTTFCRNKLNKMISKSSNGFSVAFDYILDKGSINGGGDIRSYSDGSSYHIIHAEDGTLEEWELMACIAYMHQYSPIDFEGGIEGMMSEVRNLYTDESTRLQFIEE